MSARSSKETQRPRDSSGLAKLLCRTNKVENQLALKTSSQAEVDGGTARLHLVIREEDIESIVILTTPLSPLCIELLDQFFVEMRLAMELLEHPLPHLFLFGVKG
jgi:hypothetical protein